MMKRLLLKIVTVICLTACGATAACAQGLKAGEYQVKALFLYNFINFVDWPADSSFNSSPTVNICIVGEDPFDDALGDIRGETAKGKKLSIKFYSL